METRAPVASLRIAWRPVVCGAAALFAGIGLARFGFAPFIPALAEARWFTAAQADYLGSANLLGYVAGAALARRMIRAASVPLLLRGAMLTVALQFLVCASPGGFWWFAWWRFAAGIAGGLLMVIAAPLAIARVPAGVRGVAGGIVFTGVGLGTALSGSALPWLVALGLPVAWQTLAGIVFLLTLATWRELGRFVAPEAHGGSATEGRAGAGGSRLPRTTIVLLLGAYCCNAIGFVPHTVFWVDFIARGLGRGLAAGGHYWVMLGLSAAAGPLLAGMLADRIGFGGSLRWSLLAKAAGVALPIFSTQPWALAFSSIATGSMAIGIVSLASGRVTELVPAARRQQVWGWMTTGFSIAYAATAYGLSLLYARTGSFLLLFGVGSGALLIGCVLDWVSSSIQAPAEPKGFH